MSLVTLSATELAQAIRDRQFSAKEVVTAYLQQIERVNSKINAIVYLRAEQALQEAETLDKTLRQGQPLGPLHGVPITIKDMLNTPGDIVTFGTLGLKDKITQTDSTIAKRLRQAGAILIGKTNTPEFGGAADTDNLVYGKTVNPYDLDYSSGGSSGGGAAAVAACCSALDIGSDVGGSLRIPAHYCGITTLRPSVGRIPSTGIIGEQRKGLVAQFAVEGPLARYVTDLELVLQVLAGPDFHDPRAIPMPLVPSTTVSLQKLRVAYFTHDGQVSVTPATTRAIRNAAQVLKAHGAHVVDEKPDNIHEGLEIFHELIGSAGPTGIQKILQALGTTTFSPLLLQLLELMQQKTCGLQTFMQRWARWDEYKSKILQFMQNYDVIICPVTAQAALPKDQSMWDKNHFAKIAYCWAFSLTGCPVVVVRAGTSEENLPIGAQIVARPWHEETAFAAARAIEHTLIGWHAPKLVTTA